LVAFWTLTTFLLNGALFVLVGLQLGGALDGLRSYSLTEAAAITVAIAATVIGIRLAWQYTVPYLIRALDRRPQQRARRISARQRLPLAWAGFRGGVSLAAALAVPSTLVGGGRFPGRDLLIVITFGVILVTLLVQGLTLPAVLRWASMPPTMPRAPSTASPNGPRQRPGLRHCPPSRRAWASATPPPNASATNTKSTSQRFASSMTSHRCRQTVPTRTATTTTSTTPGCAQPCSPTSAALSSPCVTPAASTTSCYVACRHRSTPRKFASPRTTPTSEPRA
jgi:Sodium/hydrogen exchanger family